MNMKKNLAVLLLFGAVALGGLPAGTTGGLTEHSQVIAAPEQFPSPPPPECGILNICVQPASPKR